ncbi:MAG: CDP-alcohol phosphatidyltransferase family protein [Acidimicrobiales bacterium]
MEPRAGSGEDRILTLPNLITTVRLALVPVFVWLLIRTDHRGWYPAALLLGGLGVTDGVDGFVARRFNQVSTVGKVLDPIADRLLLGAAAIGTVVLGAIPAWVAWLAIGREAIVATGFLLVGALGGRRMDVSRAGKAGTFGLMCAIPLFLAGHASDDWHQVAEDLAWVCIIPGLLSGWYAVVGYVRPAIAAVQEGHGATPEVTLAKRPGEAPR